jgi:hypothetical protein
MSAPDTNIKKQEKQHKPSLWGIKGAMAFGLLMIALLMFFVIGNGREDDASGVVNTDPGAATTSTAAPVDPVAPGTNESN